MLGSYLKIYRKPFLIAGAVLGFIQLGFPAHAQTIDQKKIDAAVQDIYATISGPAGKARDWEHWKELFTTDGKLGVVITGKDGQTKLRTLTPDEFIASSGKYMESKGFYEKEIHREMQRYAHLVQVFSTYECRTNETDAQPMMRGINSIVLVEEAGKLKIASLIWEQETQQNPLPINYLPSAK